MISKALRLRAIEPEDADLMWVVENDYSQWVSGDTIAPLSRHQLLQYALEYDADPFSTGQIRLMVENELNETIGIADLYDISRHHGHAFVGLYIIPEARGLHYGCDLLAILAEYAFETLGLHQLAAKIIPDNRAAIKCFTNAGFKPAGRLRSWHFSHGKRHDVQLMQLLNPQAH